LLREATRPIEIADLREVSDLRRRADDRAEIVGRETHATPLNPGAFVSTCGYASDTASLGEAIR
jgi:hypothetical protein